MLVVIKVKLLSFEIKDNKYFLHNIKWYYQEINLRFNIKIGCFINYTVNKSQKAKHILKNLNLMKILKIFILLQFA
jgi:hypothetical protein